MEDSWRLSAENQSICQSSHFYRGGERRNTKREGRNKKKGGQLEIISREPEYLLEQSLLQGGGERNTKREGTNKKWRTAGDYEQRTTVSLRVVTFIGRERRNTKREETNEKNGGQLEIIGREPEYLLEQSLLQRGEEEI